MNKQCYNHNHPQHRQRTKTANHRRNLFRLIWFAFEIDFGFNFDQEQMGLPPPLTVSVSQVLRDFPSPYHTHTVHSHTSRRQYTRMYTQAESPRSLLHFQIGLKLCFFQSKVFKAYKSSHQV